MNPNSLMPHPARVVDCIEETAHIFTLNLSLVDEAYRAQYRFTPGQFNMLYLMGVGEVAISIVERFGEENHLKHTIRAVGRVTKAMQSLKSGDEIGLRGPYGRGWPLSYAKGRDVVVLSGGLGCAPTVAIINHILCHREDYGDLYILQGLKHTNDFIFERQYEQWQKAPRTTVLLAADIVAKKGAWHEGYVTELLDKITLVPQQTIIMMCGPEIMMKSATQRLSLMGLPEEQIFWSMERNMQCGIGLCGHCQFGEWFICKDGPVFSYNQIKSLVSVRGF